MGSVCSSAEREKLSIDPDLTIVLTPSWDEKICNLVAAEVPPSSFFEVVTKAVFMMKRRAAQARESVKKRKASGEPPRSPSQASLKTADMSGLRLLEQRLSHLNLKTVEMLGDGNCQFRSFSSQLYRTPDHHLHVRASAVAQLREKRHLYSMFFDGDADMDRYIAQMAKPMTWGDEITMKAVADRFGVVIHVITSTDDYWSLVYQPDQKLVDKHLFVSYISPVHYNSVYHRDEEVRNK